MWARITALDAEVQQLRQQHAAYDTLVRAGAAQQRRALGLEPDTPAPRRRRGGLRVIPGIALITTACLSHLGTGARGPRV